MPVNKNAAWEEREEFSRWWTDSLMGALKERGHIYSFVKVTLEQDKDDGVDYLVKFRPNGKVYRIQFKIRSDKRYRDIPIVRDQPFYGIDRKVVMGRDYKGLMVTQKSDLYFVAVMDENCLYTEVYMITTEKLRPLVKKLENAWDSIAEFVQFEGEDDPVENSHYKNRREFLTNKVIRRMKPKDCIWSPINDEEDHGRVFLLKNETESFWKTYFYIPERHKQVSLPITEEKAKELNDGFVAYLKEKENDATT